MFFNQDKKELPEHDCHTSPEDGCSVCQEHPEPDMEYENHRDNLDDAFRNAAEAQNMPENELDDALTEWSEAEKEEYIRAWDEDNDMWK